jgi:3-hydroxybutyryl-CoA dehydrogenase
VSRVCVLGSGVMGAGIALSLALHGEEVRLWGRREEGVEAAAHQIDAGARFMAAQGLTDRDAVDVELTTHFERALDGADFAIEAVTEDLALKQELLARAERSLAPAAVTASTTSGLSPTRIQEQLARPDRFVVAHYAQPAQLMMLVEVVPGQRTSDETVAAVSDLLRRTGKLPALCADIPGFLFSRLQQALFREFVYLVERGDVTPETCDLVLKYGYAHRLPAMGSFEHADLAGLDLMGDVARDVWPDLSTATDPEATLVGRLRAKGKLGMKSGEGFYDWRERDADAFRAARDREIVRRLKILEEDR